MYIYFFIFNIFLGSALFGAADDKERVAYEEHLLKSCQQSKNYAEFLSLVREKYSASQMCRLPSNVEFEALVVRSYRYQQGDKLKQVRDLIQIYEKLIALVEAQKFHKELAMLQFVKFTEAVHELLLSVNKEEFIKSWLSINKYVLILFENKKMLTLPTDKNPLMELCLYDVVKKKEAENIHFAILKIKDHLIPFMIEDSRFRIRQIHLYWDEFVKDESLAFAIVNGKVSRYDGLLFIQNQSKIALSYLTGGESKHPLREKTLSTGLNLNIDIWKYLKYIEGNRVGFLPFYENKKEKEYLKYAYEELVEEYLECIKKSGNFIEYQEELKSAAIEFDQANDKGKEEVSEDQSFESSALSEEKTIDLVAKINAEQSSVQSKMADYQKEFEKAEYEALIAEEQRKRSLAVSQGKIEGKKKSQGRSKGPKKKTEKAAKQSQVLSEKTRKELAVKAQELVEKYKQEARKKMHAFCAVLNGLSKDVESAVEERGLTLEAMHRSGKGSHQVGHVEEGALSPLVALHGGRKEMEISHMNKYIEEYVNLRFLKKVEKFLFNAE